MDEDENITFLTEAQVRAIIKDEIAKASNTRTQADRTIQQKSIQLLDGKNIQVGRTNGTMIATSSDQRLGFYGITPVPQISAISQPTGSGTAGVDSSARTAISAVIAALKLIGITK